MFSSNSRPKWWQLYLTFPLLIVLFMVDSRLKISTRGHQAVQIGIVLLVYGFMHIWSKANERVLRRMDRGHYRGTVTMIQIPASGPLSADKDTVFQFPDSEINGVLSDTFEMDFIDAVSFPVDEVSQESKNESANPR